MKYILILSSLLLLWSCASNKEVLTDTTETTPAAVESSEIAQEDSLFASIKKSYCYGKCPVFELKIYNNGYAEYEGTANVDLIGKYASNVSKEAMQSILDKAISIGYKDMKDEYDHEGVTDLPSTWTSVVIDGQRKSVKKRYDYPKTLNEFETVFQAIIDKQNWKKVQE